MDERKGRHCRQRSGFKRAGGRVGKALQAKERLLEGWMATPTRFGALMMMMDGWSATQTATALPRRQFRHCKQRSVYYTGGV